MGQENSVLSDDTPPNTLSERSLVGLAEYIKSGQAKRIVVMTGAGISTAAGIPDFRSPNTGLYANLARLNLPFAEAVFDINYFRQSPEPFYVLAKELYPGRFHPTISHAFIALLASKGLLLHLFTQNIDCLERAAGVPPHLIVEAHGSFATQRCIDCGTPFPDALMKEHVVKGEVPRCVKKNDDGGSCGSLVKPDIVFFGEQLPEVFRARQHYPGLADLVLILGTSLQVYPFAGLPETVQEKTPRALFNLERVGSLGTLPDDVLCLGSCDAGVRALADELGWREELEKKWRSLVGDEEAEMQLRNAQKREQIMEDEVVRLAEEIEDVLHIEEDANDANESNESNDSHEAQKLVRAIPELQTQDRDTGQIPEVKGQEVSSNSEANTAAQEASSGSRVEATSPSRSQTSRLSKADGEDKNQDQQHSDSNTESEHGRKEGQTPTSSENQGETTSAPSGKVLL